MNNDNACICGHSKEEHGNDPKYPGSTACTEEDCQCIAYEHFAGSSIDRAVMAASLLAQFAAVRAPLEARIAELEASGDRLAFENIALAAKARLIVDIPRTEASVDAQRAIAEAREKALREAVTRLKARAIAEDVSASRWAHDARMNEQHTLISNALLEEAGIILALIDAPAVKP